MEAGVKRTFRQYHGHVTPLTRGGLQMQGDPPIPLVTTWELCNKLQGGNG